MKRLRLILVVATVLGIDSSVRANFHLFQITEIYSNADGSIQFIELAALDAGQQFVMGHTIASTQGGSMNTYTFPSNLPGDTAGKTFLIGTTGFAALNVVTPDYIVPNGFLFTMDGTLNFGEGADSWLYGMLPIGGRFSLTRNGNIGGTSPRNFAGATANFSLPQAADLDLDLKADLTVFRPSTGAWYTLESHAAYSTFSARQWGVSSDTPVPGDYDGDGKTDLGLFRASTGVWWVLLSSTNYTNFLAKQWGVSTDVPVPGDFDEDGKADFAVFRPSTGTWYVLLSTSDYTAFRSVHWGVRYGYRCAW